MNSYASFTQRIRASCLFLLEEKQIVDNSLSSVENTDLFSSTPLTLEVSVLKVLPIPAPRAGSGEFVQGAEVSRLGRVS